jgi:3-deoxy-7-phosphoheptulonate synthase
VAIGADGVIVEVHPCPEKAMSDGAQSLNFAQFRSLMQELRPYVRIWTETRAAQAVAASA